MIKNNLSKLMGIKRLKMSELSRMAGLDYKTIFYLYHDKKRGIDFDTLNKICWALECNAHELFEYVPDK